MSEGDSATTGARAVAEVLLTRRGGIDVAGIHVTGPHRLVTADGRNGCQPLGRSTDLVVTTDLLTGPAWSLGLWVCPIEDLDTATTLEWTREADPGAQRYRLVDDGDPADDPASSVFGWAWLSMLRPAMQATVANRGASPGPLPPAAAQVEHLPLRAGTWYRMVVTFSAHAHQLCIWVNGLLAGISDFEFRADRPGTLLYLGNPAMAFADLTIDDRAWTSDEVQDDFAGAASVRSREVTEELRPLYEVSTGSTGVGVSTGSTGVGVSTGSTGVGVSTGSTGEGGGWQLQLETRLTDPADLEGWTQHGCRRPPYELVAYETTPEGLLVETPDEVAEESRLYLWSPQVFEGDLAVELDFRVEQDSGFAMLVAQASGMQGEDFLGAPDVATGAMSVIARSHVRNYYWGFFRRTPTTPKHIASHTLVKNPWMRNLGLAASEPLEVGTWHRLRLVQEGAKIRGEIDGQVVLEAQDDPWQNHGPVLRHGRIALRLMYQTRIRFRDLRVWNRPGVVRPLIPENS